MQGDSDPSNSHKKRASNPYYSSSTIPTVSDMLSSTNQSASRQWPPHPALPPAPPTNAQAIPTGLPLTPYSNSYSTLDNYDGSARNRDFSASQSQSQYRAPIPYGSSSLNNNSSSSSSRRQSGPPLSLNMPSSSPPNMLNSPGSSSPQQKNHVCHICGQSFTRSHDRKRHSAIHTRAPEDSPKCHWCSKPFSRGDALKRHLDNGCDYMPDEEYSRLQPRPTR